MSEDKLTWIIDSYMEDRNEYLKGTVLMEEAVRRLGFNLRTSRYIPFSEDTEFEIAPTALALGYGTVGFLRQLRNKFPELRPGGFFESDGFSVEACNREYANSMLNYGTLIDEFPLWKLWENLPGIVDQHGPVFVRPNGVGKAFTGTLVGDRYPVEAFLKYARTSTDPVELTQANRTDLNETVRVCHRMRILGEYRFVCASGEIIAGSQYRYEGKLDQRRDIHPTAQEFAEQFIRYRQGPDRVYVMDVAVLESGDPKIVEFNNFSNSGLYMCDRVQVVRRVSEIAMAMTDT